MEINLNKNMLIILTTLGLVGLFLVLSAKAFKIFFSYIEKFSDMIVKLLGPKLKNQWSRAVLEGIFLTATVMMAIIFGSDYQYKFIVVIFYFIFFIVIGAIVKFLKQQLLPSFSILELLASKINKNNYFVNRLILILDQGNSLMFLILAIVVTLTFFIELPWPSAVYFIMVLVIPIYANIWIYFHHKPFIGTSAETINIRRLISYVLLAVFVINDSYFKFQNHFFVSKQLDTNSSDFISYIASAIFIALDRLLKALIDDYQTFRRKQSSK